MMRIQGLCLGYHILSIRHTEPGQAISCCIFSNHFLFDILSNRPVKTWSCTRTAISTTEMHCWLLLSFIPSSIAAHAMSCVRSSQSVSYVLWTERSPLLLLRAPFFLHSTRRVVMSKHPHSVLHSNLASWEERIKKLLSIFALLVI